MMTSAKQQSQQPQQQSSVHCCIVEDHCDVVPFIYSFWRSKKIVEEDKHVCFVHFDSHPDLGIPSQFRSVGEWRSFDNLYTIATGQSGISDFICPLLGNNILSQVCWVKPPWCSQLPCGNHKIDIHNGIRDEKDGCGNTDDDKYDDDNSSEDGSDKREKADYSGPAPFTTSLHPYYFDDLLSCEMDRDNCEPSFSADIVACTARHSLTLTTATAAAAARGATDKSRNKTGIRGDFVRVIDDNCNDFDAINTNEYQCGRKTSNGGNIDIDSRPNIITTRTSPIMISSATASAAAAATTSMSSKRGWIWDICLDYFSVNNPYLEELADYIRSDLEERKEAVEEVEVQKAVKTVCDSFRYLLFREIAEDVELRHYRQHCQHQHIISSASSSSPCSFDRASNKLQGSGGGGGGGGGSEQAKKCFTEKQQRLVNETFLTLGVGVDEAFSVKQGSRTGLEGERILKNAKTIDSSVSPPKRPRVAAAGGEGEAAAAAAAEEGAAAERDAQRRDDCHSVHSQLVQLRKHSLGALYKALLTYCEIPSPMEGKSSCPSAGMPTSSSSSASDALNTNTRNCLLSLYSSAHQGTADDLLLLLPKLRSATRKYIVSSEFQLLLPHAPANFVPPLAPPLGSSTPDNTSANIFNISGLQGSGLGTYNNSNNVTVPVQHMINEMCSFVARNFMCMSLNLENSTPTTSIPTAATTPLAVEADWGLPMFITIARSALDDFTPKGQVDAIQQMVVVAVERTLIAYYEMHHHSCDDDNNNNNNSAGTDTPPPGVAAAVGIPRLIVHDMCEDPWDKAYTLFTSKQDCVCDPLPVVK